MDDWIANKTDSDQGTDFREVPVKGKVSELEFSIKPKSVFWRAGFKLHDVNGDALPLRTSNSFLFHLGSTSSKDKYGYTAYLDGEHIDYLNKEKKYPEDKVLSVKLVINHKNFLWVYVNDSLQFKLKSHLINPDIREKVALVAWGDADEFEVSFSNIDVKNWKQVEDAKTKSPSDNKKSKISRSQKNPILRITGNENVFFDSQIDGSAFVGGKRNKSSKTKIGNHKLSQSKKIWFMNPQIMVPFAGAILAAIIGAPWLSNILSSNNSDQKNSATQTELVNFRPSASPVIAGTLRPLKPLETGKKIGELPNGVYFFGHSSWLETEIKDPEEDWLEASSKDSSSSFELQKKENRYYLVGYVSDEAQSKIGTILTQSIYTQLFPNKWGGTNNLIAIPFDAVYTIKEREIDLDEVKSVRIFDIGFKEAVESPEVHKTAEL